MPVPRLVTRPPSQLPRFDGRRGEPAFQQGFTIGADVGDGGGGDELETENCDLNHGNSGGPIFAWWNNGTDPRVVAVVSSQLTNAQQSPFPSPDDNVFAGGTRSPISAPGAFELASLT